MATDLKQLHKLYNKHQPAVIAFGLRGTSGPAWARCSCGRYMFMGLAGTWFLSNRRTFRHVVKGYGLLSKLERADYKAGI